MRTRNRLASVTLALVVTVALISAVVGLGPSSAVGAAATPSGPACQFNGDPSPEILGVKAGENIALTCTGFPVLHPYLLMETSLLLGIDPKAAPLLTGNIVSLPGLLALFAALPEINPQALTFPFSDLSGHLNFTYTLPSSQASDPNATCPPSASEIQMGLVGCGLVLIDLTTFKPVGAGSAVVQYFGSPLPGLGTLALSPRKAMTGQAVSVSDAPGATTYWWPATEEALGELLGGGALPPPVITVTLSHGKTAVTAANTISVSPPVYSNPVLTPPKISGTFTVPPGVSGSQKVTVVYFANLIVTGASTDGTTRIRIG